MNEPGCAFCGASGDTCGLTAERRSFRIGGRSTSLQLERCFWESLERLASDAGLTLPEAIRRIDEQRRAVAGTNLASYCRVLCLRNCAL